MFAALPERAAFNIAVHAALKGLNCGNSSVRELPRGNKCKLIEICVPLGN